MTQVSERLSLFTQTELLRQHSIVVNLALDKGLDILGVEIIAHCLNFLHTLKKRRIRECLFNPSIPLVCNGLINAVGVFLPFK